MIPVRAVPGAYGMGLWQEKTFGFFIVGAERTKLDDLPAYLQQMETALNPELHRLQPGLQH